MQVELKKLKPNPFRDFQVDPIDPDQIALLTKSIKDHGFWGGAVLRRVNGDIQIGAGHTRIQAAIKAGEQWADLHVAEISDADMALVYAIENATQRGNSSTAVAGSIASAIRLLVRAILLGPDHLAQIQARSQKAWETARGNLTSGDGLGWDMVLEFLRDVPRINKSIVAEQLAMLKKSGDYQRIVSEVTAEIEQERKGAVAALERVEKEREKARQEAERREIEAREARQRAREAKEKLERKQAQEEALKAEADAKLAEKRRAE